MVSMVNKQKIIQYWHIEKKSEVQIASLLGVSRNTVRRYVKSFVRALEQSQASGLPEPVLSDFLLTVPKYNAKNRGKRKLTPEIMQEIDRHLRENEEKRRAGKGKQVVKGIDIWEILQGSGHDIGYTVVCDYILAKKSGHQEAFIRQEYNPGENCEFDWCDVKLTIGGVERKLYLAVFTMCKSNYRFAMIFQRQDTLAFMEAHIAFFDHLGRVPLRMNYDNMRVAIAEFVGCSEKKPTVALLQLSTFYGFSFRFCNIFCGHEKGHVERSVEYIRRKAFARRDLFETIALGQNYLETVCNGLNDKNLAGSTYTIGQLMAEERDLMLPHPGRMECFLMQQARIDKYATFTLGTNHYSVPDHLVGQKVDVKVYANQLKIYFQGTLLDTQIRDYGNGRWIIRLEHYLNTLERKPGALHGSAALKQAPWQVRQLYEAAFTENAREFIEVMQYCKTHQISHERLWKVYQQLRSVCPNDVSADKIKVLLGNDPGDVILIYPDTEIARHARDILTDVGDILHKN